MKTKLLYLEDPYQKTVDATVLDVISENQLILDQTIFYPMGGGQPTDQGKIGECEVNQVRNIEGEIHHFIKGGSCPHVGEKVLLQLDYERRFKNMRAHSAGHIIDFALFLLGYSPAPLHPQKGDHGKKPFILYSGSIEKNIQEELQKKTDELILQNLRFTWSFETLETLEKIAIYLQPALPQNKPLRALHLEGVGTVADGGTIVGFTKEVGQVTILSIETSDNTTCISYKVP